MKSPQLIFGQKASEITEQVPLPVSNNDIVVQDDMSITVVDVIQDKLIQYELISCEEFNKFAEMATLLRCFQETIMRPANAQNK